MRSYIKIYGPPVLKAIKSLENVAVDMPEVCIMNTVLSHGMPHAGARESWIINYFSSSRISIPVERCRNIISKSGESLGEFDFFFEWFTEPSMAQLNELIERIEKALAPLGCQYTITTKK